MSTTPTDTPTATVPPVTVDADADAVENTPVRIGSFLSEHPIATAGAAIAAGAVIGLLLPRWRIGTSAGSKLARTATKTAKAVAAAGTVRTVLSGLNAAGGSVKAGAHRLAEHLPDTDAVKAGARRALEHASETAQKAGEKVASTARRTIKPGED